MLTYTEVSTSVICRIPHTHHASDSVVSFRSDCMLFSSSSSSVDFFISLIGKGIEDEGKGIEDETIPAEQKF
jgi:hypothetical protein